MHNDTKGFLLIGISTISFSLMSLFVKLCALPASEIVFIRGLFQTIIAMIACYKKEIHPFGPKEMRGLLFFSGLTGGVSVGLYFYCIQFGNLGEITAIFFVAPAVTTILAAIFLKERLRFSAVLSIVLCAIGTALVIKPKFIFPEQIVVDNPTERTALYISVFGLFVSAVSYLMISVTGKRSHYLCSVFYFGFLSTLISIIPLVYLRPVSPNWIDVGYLTLIILCAYSGQVTVNYGLQLTSSIATLIRNLDIVFAFFYSFFIFNETVSVISIIGAVLICFGTGLIVWDKYRINKKEEFDLLEEVDLSAVESETYAHK